MWGGMIYNGFSFMPEAMAKTIERLKTIFTWFLIFKEPCPHGAKGFPEAGEGKPNCKHFANLCITFSNVPLAKGS